MLFELIQAVWGGALADLEEVMRSDDGPVRKLRELLRRHVIYLADSTVNASLFLHEVRALSEEKRKVIEVDQERYQRAITKLVKDGQKQGLIRSDLEAQLVTFELLGAVNWTYR